MLAAPELGSAGKVFAVRAGKNVIGADPGCQICLEEDPEVSTEHALILHRGDSFYLADRMSTNGTWVNGQEVDPSGSTVLQDRDRILFGKTETVFLTILQPDKASKEASN